MYIIKFKAMAECSDYGEALDATMVARMINATDYAAASDKTSAPCKLYEKNHRLGGLFVLGQDSVHGLAMFSSTVTTDHPLMGKSVRRWRRWKQISVLTILQRNWS